LKENLFDRNVEYERARQNDNDAPDDCHSP
jgi:hypothetical protein